MRPSRDVATTAPATTRGIQPNRPTEIGYGARPPLKIAEKALQYSKTTSEKAAKTDRQQVVFGLYLRVQFTRS